MEKKIAILDVDGLCYVIGHPNKILDENGEPVKVKSLAGNMVFTYTEKTEEELTVACEKVISSVLNDCGATHYLGYMKGKDTIKSRLLVNPDYKSNRKTEPPAWWNFVQKQLQKSWGFHYVDGIEVDDAVNITRLELENSFIVAVDGDLLGLESINPHWNWSKQEWITKNKFDAERKFWSDTICGQSGDGIKGLPGKGEAFFKKNIEDPWTTKGGSWHSYVLDAYVGHYKDVDKGICEFFKMYNSLYILRQNDTFQVPQPIQFIKQTVQTTPVNLFD